MSEVLSFSERAAEKVDLTHQALLMTNLCLSQRFCTVMDELTQQWSQTPSYDSSYLTCLHFLLLTPAPLGILQIHQEIAHLEYKTQGLHLQTLSIGCTCVKFLGWLLTFHPHLQSLLHTLTQS